MVSSCGRGFDSLHFHQRYRRGFHSLNKEIGSFAPDFLLFNHNFLAAYDVDTFLQSTEGAMLVD